MFVCSFFGGFLFAQVHHAGLIPVWKTLIEDLFNANKIKVLFATETLAAGVNMPARTTVISTVTKRINSEIVKLKTSQLLQMVETFFFLFFKCCLIYCFSV